MKKQPFTTELLEDYYENRFFKDLKSFFTIEKIGDAEYVKGFKTSLQFIFNQPSAPSLLVQQSAIPPKKKRGTEEEILFLALLSFMFSSEEAINRLTGSEEKEKAASCMTDFGFPWLYSANSMELSSFLTKYSDTLDIHIEKEVYAIHDAMTLVEPFMLEKLIPFLRNWDNGSLCMKIRFFDTLSEHLHDCIDRGLRDFYRSRFYKHKGLSGLSLTHQEFYAYYNERFPQQIRSYFSDAEDKGNYLLILGVPYNNNKRWDDGNPGRDIKDNFMFATFILYFTLAQQSILEIAKEASDDFHQYSGWPMISSGPGGGPYLHPLYMLEYAGLAPKKYEAPLLLEMVEHYFPYFRQEMNTIINGNVNAAKNAEAGKRFVEAIKNRKRSQINKYLDKEEKNIKELLAKWQTSSADSLRKLLIDENLPVQLECK